MLRKKQNGYHFKMAALNENLYINSHYLCYPLTFTMLSTITLNFGQKYCRSSKRGQQEIQEQS